MAQVRYLLTLEGRVQRVGMRNFAQSQAVMLGLSGWVQNREDGSVQIGVQGEEESVGHFLGLLRQGNYWIRVDNLSAVPLPVLERQEGFRILY